MRTTVAAPTPMVEQFLQTFGFEHRTTMNVLQAVPGDRLDFKPHERSWPAGELAWHIAYSQYGLARVVAAGRFEEYQQPPTPAKLDDIVAGCESYYQQTCEVLSKLTPEQLQGKISLPNGHTLPASGLLWSGVLFHQIHHRGQLSIYIRMMGGKVPSIYGPSGDENPFA